MLIVDEIGYLPVGSGGSNLLFQLVNACCERRAMVMTGIRRRAAFLAEMDRLDGAALNRYRPLGHFGVTPWRLKSSAMWKSRQVDHGWR
ncbi:ATP-binding protein [Variovorax ginsengisoli]|uniref:ATP-binding protein n=1 Tax=Variovorax ginsengisoli TaxID=363844 RepID=A0ABT8SDN5_9BURK|nr:ATP-binding protein [Variovorax ginsengisoli]MDN8617778.1 ATP-binding protein [Variovorax ginsengisoli]MDO1536948.1 ATP-binding protein [Variovorax ginsengisoli]